MSSRHTYHIELVTKSGFALFEASVYDKGNLIFNGTFWSKEYALTKVWEIYHKLKRKETIDENKTA